MPVNIIGLDKDRIVSAAMMRDGQLGKIVSWDAGGQGQNYDSLADSTVGLIVQRIGDDLCVVGERKDQEFEGLCSRTYTACRVRILPNGTLLRVEGNE